MKLYLYQHDHQPLQPWKSLRWHYDFTLSIHTVKPLADFKQSRTAQGYISLDAVP